jgi:cell division protein FtsA
MPVRVGIPKYVGGLSNVVQSPRYATAIGLLLEGLSQRQRMQQTMSGGSVKQLLRRMRDWFQGTF